MRASLLGVAVVNFFNLMFSALVLLYAVRTLHLSAGLLGLVLGCGAFGGLLGAAVTKAIAARIGVGLAYVAGCFVFTAPLALVPLAPWPTGPGTTPAVILLLFGAEFLSGFGVMMLDISIGSIFAAVIPDTLRSRVTGAFSAINYGTRPLGALLGGLLGSAAGLRPALWVAVVGGIAGAALLLPSPLPRFRLPEGALWGAVLSHRVDPHIGVFCYRIPVRPPGVSTCSPSARRPRCTLAAERGSVSRNRRRATRR